MDKIELNCPPTSPYAACVKSELTLPTFTKITKECFSVEDIDKDQYSILTDIRNDIKLTTLTGCLILSSNPTIENVLQSLINEICLLKTEVAAIKTVNTIQETKITNLQTNTCP